MADLSYHDVVAFIVQEDGTESSIRISDWYGYELTCNRVGGWCLWKHKIVDGDKNELVAGEFDYPKLRIEIGGIEVLGLHPVDE